MKDLSSVLHLYLGCECLFMNMKSKLLGIYPSEVEPGKMIALAQPERQEFYIEDTQLICSRLSDMTEEDAIELIGLSDVKIIKIGKGGIQYTTPESEFGHEFIYFGALDPYRFTKLLSKGYWLFGDEAFDNGLIIDKKTL